MNKKRYLLLFIILTITLPFFYFWFLFYEIKNNFKFFCYNEWVIELYSKDYKNTLKKWNIYEVKSYKWEFKSSTWEYLYEIYINNWDIKSKNYKKRSRGSPFRTDSSRRKGKTCRLCHRKWWWCWGFAGKSIKHLENDKQLKTYGN